MVRRPAFKYSGQRSVPPVSTPANISLQRTAPAAEPGSFAGRGNVAARAVVGLLAMSLALVACSRVQHFVVPTTGMEPAISKGDTIAVAPPKPGQVPLRGQIVVFSAANSPDHLFIKRVVALAGETVEIKDKALLLNGAPASEPYVSHRDALTFPDDPKLGEVRRRRDQLASLRVPPGSVFLLGDNRDDSYDSRHFGPVPVQNITGYVLAK